MKAFIVLPFLLFNLFIFSNGLTQITDILQIDSELTFLYQNLEKRKSDDVINAPIFSQKLLFHLKNPITFEHKLDSLAKCIKIISSPDNLVKFYSWDSQEDGTWHTIEAVAQFKNKSGETVIKSLITNSNKGAIDFSDSEIYEVNEYFFEGKNYYVTFGGGTHGSGMQHTNVQIFNFENDSLIKCTSCFSNNLDLIIEYPRGDKINLTFDEKTKTISYSEVKNFEDQRFYGRPSKKIVKLKLKKGVYKYPYSMKKTIKNLN